MKITEVLVIDDDPDIANLVKNILGSHSMNVSHASTIDDGFSLFKKRIPHVVLLDINLNNENGFQFLKEKNNNPSYKNIPTIIMTTQLNKSNLALGMALGANDFISKPIKNTTLVQKIKKTLKEFSFPQKSFTDKSSIPAKITVNGSIENINELGCMLFSQTKFHPNENIVIDGPLIQELGLGNCRFKPITDLGRSMSGMYKTEVSFVGIQERSSSKIRALRSPTS